MFFAIFSDRKGYEERHNLIKLSGHIFKSRNQTKGQKSILTSFCTLFYSATFTLQSGMTTNGLCRLRRWVILLEL